MSNDEQTTITLSPEMAKRVRSYLKNGRFATEAEVLDNALDLLDPEEERFERWLREEVIPAAEEFAQNPSAGLTVEQVKASLFEEYQKVSAAESKAS